MALRLKLLNLTDTYQTALTKYFTRIGSRMTLIVLEYQGLRVLVIRLIVCRNSAGIRLNHQVIKFRGIKLEVTQQTTMKKQKMNCLKLRGLVKKFLRTFSKKKTKKQQKKVNSQQT